MACHCVTDVNYVCRWDDDAVSILPEYLKKYFISVMSIFRDFEDELEPHHKYRGYYLRKAVIAIIYFHKSAS